MTTTNKSANGKATQDSHNNLEAQYHEVGILAVAAAMRYQHDLHERRDGAPTHYRPAERD